ncbi:hypothetical protein [uncultured Roseobacter sp.]|uniref:hypothetical protein n=1 Tax=uncultured Roseobacter sp. TaxID=114847 RepID=UPI00263655B3|nr:hypothetical protein [uncultured Roseobacter sp.]
MKNLLIVSGLAVLFACPALAREWQCVPSVFALRQHQEIWGQQVIEEQERPAIGREGTVQYRLWANPETRAWSLSGTLDSMTCYLGGGNDYGSVTISLLLDGQPEGEEI